MFGALETATEQIYMHVPLTVDSLKDLINEVHGAAKSIYPERTFVKIAE